MILHTQRVSCIMTEKSQSKLLRNPGLLRFYEKTIWWDITKNISYWPTLMTKKQEEAQRDYLPC